MNSPIRRVSAGCLLLVVALLINLTYIQAFWADELNAHPDNRRVTISEYARERGPILAADDTRIAVSEEVGGDFEFLRKYPDGPLYAPVTGYYSYQYGRSATERAQNAILSGEDDRLFVRRLIDLVTGEEPKGGGVKLTIDPAAQEAAYETLGNNKGSVVAIDVRTGAVLAMVSKPSYDPNPLASHSLSEQQEHWEQLQADDEQPHLNRAIAQTLPPGSVFKLVTAAAALESGEYEADSTVPGPAEYDLPQSERNLPNQNGEPCGSDGETTLTNALRISCNTAFAHLGEELGADALRDQAQRLGFNAQPLTDDDMNAAASVFPDDPDAPQTVLSAIGQFDVRATPLQIAMVSAAIANDGVLMEPYLVDELRAPDLVSTLHQTEPEEASQAMSAGTARQLTDMMVEVVEDGTGSNASMSGIEVAGKTGTAQSAPERPPYAWFTSFAPADDPQVAVAVVIEEAPDTARDDIGGGRLAAPIARAVMEAVMDE
ncbi:penicillin-binding protein 2 [Actinobacteria bacterium YIM 96077]|uniref:Penicillin-binding protein 2 n=1 Tax=Phytoactinopolyspora halophila TaxID=1981511 RepID=A0A329QQN1_9ACTN|nr:penicillin-binding protein 2 [Phytoactinopolyspora halophila]AYY11380.1 penicillin-binding protein 2 [Actinobacteria bacterium YIM 96077]RAW14670.1 penicillin-binding protein 2 [Phytoactinopolyspora halophila]